MQLLAFAAVTVTLEDRPWGGVRVRSDDLGGLILSGESRAEVVACIAPAIEALLRHRGIEAVVYLEEKPSYE